MQEDSLIMRAIAEVAFNGYIDQYGNRVDVLDRIMREMKFSEDFYKKLESKLDIDKIADGIISKVTNLSMYDRDKFKISVNERVQTIVAQKLAEKALAEFNDKNLI